MRSVHPQGTAALDLKRLIDGFMADAHRLVVRKVDPQAAGDLLRTPRSGPSSILLLAVPPSLPRHDRPARRNAARSDDAGQLLFDMAAQSGILRKLRCLWTTCRSFSVPLSGRRVILQTAAPGGRVAPYLVSAERPSRRPISRRHAPGRGGARSPRAPPRRDTVLIAASPGPEHRWWHARPPPETILFRKAVKYRLRAQQPCCSFGLQRTPRTTGGRDALPAAVAPEIAAVPVQTEPGVASEYPMQPP